MSEQMDSKTRAPNLAVVEGCLLGLGDLLSAFGLSRDDDVELRERVYDKLRRVCPRPTEEGARRSAMRSGVDVLADHCALFADFVVGDAEFWLDTLRGWAFAKNRDDHKTGWRAILAFFR